MAWHFFRIFVLFFSLGAVGAPVLAQAQERILAEVVVMRHGIRAPILPGVSSPSLTERRWPEWEDGPGQLTRHGRDVVSIVGQDDGAFWRRSGLVAAGCPSVSVFTVIADTDQRTLDTAKAVAGAAFPSCDVPVTPATTLPQNPFKPVETAETVRLATNAMSQALADFHPNSEMAELMTSFGGVLKNPYWTLAPSTIEVSRGGWPVLHGPLLAAFQITDTFMMEYEQGMQAGWGALTAADVGRLLALNTLYARLTRRSAFLASVESAPVVGLIKETFARSLTGKKHVLLIVGHDDTLNALAGRFGLHWQAAGLPVDMPLPAGALIFDLVQNARGRQAVRFRYSAPTLEDARFPERLRKHGIVSVNLKPGICKETESCDYGVFSSQ
ncbi:histidine phosphatase family protein [Gluconobacter kanchanaburiensis]|uniref:Phosphoanhydride phosphohydrolase n=1 Tax=Gluconobacter kanchanaburiensis NBRC 103587 TaxID=1307948 RepID=A0A511B7M0_9PROT|nr:histidine-type phosphatase [Gluconobacter kanchanaburiensis]MBF0862428.1 hypothetical protein [Gluconobacter kanchanaburiensis]GBR68662.1 hypothetical protein AA103587_0920 [Gluconobacter kanchanaburiensis NBRC 103587]GEK96450.1 phosphoanhydride phosphohydrolase [Gluconobacter kanchanaburiensis NBRC 103587]